MDAKAQLIHARTVQNNRIKELEARERLRPCIVGYNLLIKQLSSEGNELPEIAAMAHLTNIFRGSYQEVLKQIEDSGKKGMGAVNAIKRSAGTNFQGLCEYAILKYVQKLDAPICVGPNAPNSLKNELTIHGFDADGGEFSVEPDIDICLWMEHGGPKTPVIFVSAKTSLADRAGQAARWKLYLDLHQTSCTYISSIHDCPINRTKVKMKTSHPITHSIVTANIYKIDSTLPEGELKSGQCRNNTYMFKHKYTTRNDSVEYLPKGWSRFPAFAELIKTTFVGFPKD